MRCAVIMPPRIKNLIPPDMPGQSGYHLTLADQVLGNTFYYLQYRANRDRNHMVILDNAAYELGNSLGFGMLYDAITILDPQVIVLPDVLHDMRKTIAVAQSFHINFRSTDTCMVQNPQFMIVPQGSNAYEWEECLVQMLEVLPSDFIGISRINEDFDGGLERCYQALRKHCSWAKIHLLGFGNDLQQYVELAKNHKQDLFGIDTAKPITYAYYGIELTEHTQLNKKRPANYFNLGPEDFDTGLLKANCEFYYSLFQ